MRSGTSTSRDRRQRDGAIGDEHAGVRSQRTGDLRDFAHFVEIYVAASHCIQNQEDIEEVARDFLAGQAAQNIRYTEFTHTAWVHVEHANLGFEAQLAALNRARTWARHEHGIESGIVIDIPRNITADEGITVANWAISGAADGVVAFGLGGNETNNPPERFRLAFERARAAGLPSVPHAGETVGPPVSGGLCERSGRIVLAMARPVRQFEDYIKCFTGGRALPLMALRRHDKICERRPLSVQERTFLRWSEQSPFMGSRPSPRSNDTRSANG